MPPRRHRQYSRCAVSGWAQNTFPATGDVGIGTTKPAAKLQVIGTSYLGENTNGTAVIDAYNGNAYFGDNTATNGVTVASTGNIGIGTTSPGSKLEVKGSIKLTAGSGGSVTYKPVRPAR